jgi:hypothetical protein
MQVPLFFNQRAADLSATETHIHDAKIKAIHFKEKIGKFHNVINPNHRHDEEHEKETDRKRTAVAESHRFESFAPERDGNNIKWYVDGRDYFWAISVALDKAKETIYIEDWWLSPELFLRRPPHVNQEYRIDQILKRRAEAGVKIYVIVYKEACCKKKMCAGRLHLTNAGAPIGPTSPNMQLCTYKTRFEWAVPGRYPRSRQHPYPTSSGSQHF